MYTFYAFQPRAVPRARRGEIEHNMHESCVYINIYMCVCVYVNVVARKMKIVGTVMVVCSVCHHTTWMSMSVCERESHVSAANKKRSMHKSTYTC